MDREDWRAAIHGVAKRRTRLSDFTFTFTYLGQWDFADVVKLRALMRGPWIIQVFKEVSLWCISGHNWPSHFLHPFLCLLLIPVLCVRRLN